MTDCLATTGSDTLLPFAIIATVLLAAGVLGLVAAKKRAGWSAFLVIPLLVGAALLGSAAPSAQAASGVPCPTTPAASAPVTPAATPTPTETPACTPTPALADYRDDIDNWGYRGDDGFDGFYSEFPEADGPTVQALIDASTTQPAQVTVTANVLLYQNESWVPEEVTYTVALSQGGLEDPPVLLATDLTPFIYVNSGPLVDAIGAEFPATPSYTTAVSAVVTITQDDGCGGVVFSTITFDGPILLA